MRRHAEGLLTLLRGMGLGVYAEGVIRADDLQVLWALGFDGATGPAVTAARIARGAGARRRESGAQRPDGNRCAVAGRARCAQPPGSVSSLPRCSRS